jgi:hypothetical protein
MFSLVVITEPSGVGAGASLETAGGKPGSCPAWAGLVFVVMVTHLPSKDLEYLCFMSLGID